MYLRLVFLYGLILAVSSFQPDVRRSPSLFSSGLGDTLLQSFRDSVKPGGYSEVNKKANLALLRMVRRKMGQDDGDVELYKSKQAGVLNEDEYETKEGSSTGGEAYDVGGSEHDRGKAAAF